MSSHDLANRNSVTEQLIAAGLLPVIRADSTDAAIALGKALYRGGIHALEVTQTVPHAPEVIRRLATELGADALLGAGTLLDCDGAKACVAAGARFLVSPGFVPGLADYARSVDLPLASGALTPSEVMAAVRERVDFVKVFPCSALGGASYLKALGGPFPGVRWIPTGGVTLETLTDYVRAGAAALGVGAALADAKRLEREGSDAIVELARRYVERYRAAKQGD